MCRVDSIYVQTSVYMCVSVNWIHSPRIVFDLVRSLSFYLAAFGELALIAARLAAPQAFVCCCHMPMKKGIGPHERSRRWGGWQSIQARKPAPSGGACTVYICPISFLFSCCQFKMLTWKLTPSDLFVFESFEAKRMFLHCSCGVALAHTELSECKQMVPSKIKSSKMRREFISIKQTQQYRDPSLQSYGSVALHGYLQLQKKLSVVERYPRDSDAPPSIREAVNGVNLF